MLYLPYHEFYSYEGGQNISVLGVCTTEEKAKEMLKTYYNEEINDVLDESDNFFGYIKNDEVTGIELAIAIVEENIYYEYLDDCPKVLK